MTQLPLGSQVKSLIEIQIRSEMPLRAQITTLTPPRMITEKDDICLLGENGLYIMEKKGRRNVPNGSFSLSLLESTTSLGNEKSSKNLLTRTEEPVRMVSGKASETKNALLTPSSTLRKKGLTQMSISFAKATMANRNEFVSPRGKGESTTPRISYAGATRQLSFNGFLCGKIIGDGATHCALFPDKDSLKGVFYNLENPPKFVKNPENGWKIIKNNAKDATKKFSNAQFSIGQLIAKQNIKVAENERLVWADAQVVFDEDANAFEIKFKSAERVEVVAREVAEDEEEETPKSKKSGDEDEDDED